MVYLSCAYNTHILRQCLAIKKSRWAGNFVSHVFLNMCGFGAYYIVYLRGFKSNVGSFILEF